MRHASRMKAWVFWMIALAASTLVATLVYVLLSQPSQPTPVATAPVAARSTPPPVAVSPTPTPTPSPTPNPTVSPPVLIEQSMPEELYVPSLDIKRDVAKAPCPIVNGKIDPAHDDYMRTCAVRGAGLRTELPGTSAPNAAMIVGHTWHAKPTWQASVDSAAFNALYNWDKGDAGEYTLKVGDEVWVRTEASGSRWLVYTVTGFDEPTKTVGNDNLWGFQEQPVPGQLKLVGCQQKTDGTKATNNIVVNAMFARVQG